MPFPTAMFLPMTWPKLGMPALTTWQNCTHLFKAGSVSALPYPSLPWLISELTTYIYYTYHIGWKLFIYTSLFPVRCEFLEARTNDSIVSSLHLLTQRLVRSLCSTMLCWITIIFGPHTAHHLPCYIRWGAQQKRTEAHFLKNKKEPAVLDNPYTDS